MAKKKTRSILLSGGKPSTVRARKTTGLELAHQGPGTAQGLQNPVIVTLSLRGAGFRREAPAPWRDVAIAITGVDRTALI